MNSLYTEITTILTSLDLVNNSSYVTSFMKIIGESCDDRSEIWNRQFRFKLNKADCRKEANGKIMVRHGRNKYFC